jgi:nucleotide-binding universal stress UspA family protein
MWPIKNILIATDFSELSNDAHEAACAIARQHKARLIVLHVAEKPVVSYIEKASELSPEEFQHKLWDTLRWPRENESGLTVEHRVKDGEAVKEIVREATEHDVDLIVMGASGKTGLLRWFTGSVTDDVARHAPCSVLLVKPPRTAQSVAAERAEVTRAEQEHTAPERVEPMMPSRPAPRATPATGPAPVTGTKPMSPSPSGTPSIAAAREAEAVSH